MKTHQIQVHLMINPQGVVFATLAITELAREGRTEFRFREEVKAEYTVEQLSALVAGFIETLVQDRRPEEAHSALCVEVQELRTDPKNEIRCAMAGAFAARTLLKEMDAKAA